MWSNWKASGRVRMHFVRREWRVRCNLSQIQLQQLACGRHPVAPDPVMSQLPPSLDKHIWTSVSVRLSLILSRASPPCELTLNWHWGETRRQLTSLTDFWHNYFRCQCQAHASNMYGENTIVLQFKSSKTEFIWNWQCEYCSKYHRDHRERWKS